MKKMLMKKMLMFTSQYEEYDDHTDAFNEDFDEEHDNNGYERDDHYYYENQHCTIV